LVLILHLLEQRGLQLTVVGLLAVGVIVYFIRDSAKEKAAARTAATGIPSPLPKASPMVPLDIEIPANWRGGLVGEYFSRPDFDGLSLRRIDEIIRFAWDGHALLPWMKAGKVSIRWTGGLYAPVNGTYLFTLRGNGGLKLTIGTKCVFNEMNTIHPTPTTLPVPLNEGTYVFALEYVHDKGPISILFTSAAQPMAPDLPPGPPPTLVHDPSKFTPFDATPPDVRKAISVDAKTLQPGLWAERIVGTRTERKAVTTDSGFQWDTAESDKPELGTYRWSGYLKVEKFGTYKFNVSQEAKLTLDDVVIFSGLLGECALEEGWHKFVFEYTEVLCAARIVLSWREGSNSSTSIPAAHFFRGA
jgi:hypothetical protein